MSDDQLRLIARMLDQISTAIPVIMPYAVFGGINVGRCRCGAIGEVVGDQLRYEHTDDCLLALNARLQETMRDVNTKAGEG